MKKIILLLAILTCIIISPVFAASNTILLSKAKHYTNQKSYTESISILKQILANSPEDNIKIETLFLIADNYSGLKDWDNTLKYLDLIINIEQKEHTSKEILSAYLCKLVCLSYKLNDSYVQNNKLDNIIIKEIAKSIYSVITYTNSHVVVSMSDNDRLETSTEIFTTYALYILNATDINPILQFRLTNMVLPYLDQYEDHTGSDACTSINKTARTTLPFFRVYFILLKKVQDTDDNTFITANTTKEKVLNVIKNKTTVLKADYDKDLFEALNYYYTGDISQAVALKSLIKENYNDKYKIGTYDYEYSFTDYVFNNVQSYVRKNSSHKKSKKSKKTKSENNNISINSAIYTYNNNTYATLDCIKIINNTTKESYYYNELSIKDQNRLDKMEHKTFNNAKCINVTKAQKILQKEGLDIVTLSCDINPQNPTVTTNQQNVLNHKSAFDKTVDVLENTGKILNQIDYILGR